MRAKKLKRFKELPQNQPNRRPIRQPVDIGPSYLILSLIFVRCSRIHKPKKSLAQNKCSRDNFYLFDCNHKANYYIITTVVQIQVIDDSTMNPTGP